MGLGSIDSVIDDAERAQRLSYILLAETASPTPGLWWLSFCDNSRPAGSQFLGAVVVEADGFGSALMRSHHLGVNPGGGVSVTGPLSVESIGVEWRDRLLTREEAESIPEPL